MTTSPEHEHPQYVTKADLEAFEGRFINRLAEMELRVTRDLNTSFWRMVALILPVYAVVLAGFVALWSKLP